MLTKNSLEAGGLLSKNAHKNLNFYLKMLYLLNLFNAPRFGQENAAPGFYADAS